MTLVISFLMIMQRGTLHKMSKEFRKVPVDGMGLDAEIKVFLIYAAVIAMVFIFGRLMIVPVKILFRLIINSLAGGAVLLLLNLIGAGLGITMPVNIITAAIAGILGLPGAVCLIIYFNWIV